MSLNLEELVKKLEAYRKSPEGIKAAEKNRLKFQKENEWRKKIYDFIESVDPNDIPSLMDKFIKREEKYEEFQYTVMHRHKCSDLFNIVFDLATQYGNDGDEVLNKYDSDFMGGAYEYKGYVFVVYIGQGSFYRIFNDEECIFQTT
jgi:hypothetical protein